MHDAIWFLVGLVGLIGYVWANLVGFGVIGVPW